MPALLAVPHSHPVDHDVGYFHVCGANAMAPEVGLGVVQVSIAAWCLRRGGGLQGATNTSDVRDT